MKFIAGVVVGVLTALLVGTASLWIILAKPPETKSAPKTPAASVTKIAKEDELGTIILTEDAERRLKVRTATVKVELIPHERFYGGEVTIPAGRSTFVTAPMNGILQAPTGGVPQPGQAVSKGQTLFSLLPLLTPEARTTLAAAHVEAEGQVKNARTQVDAAKIALERAQRLLREQAGTQRNLDEGQAQYDLALKTLEAAEARRDLLAVTAGEVEKGTAAPLNIQSPQNGMVRNLSAEPGQFVPAGASLFEVVDLSVVWVRVPVYVGDLTEIEVEKDAAVGNLTAKPGATHLKARPVKAPPAANPLAATVDLFYAIDNTPRSFAPGQRVGVTLKLHGESESPTVPCSALVYDINGGTWVYEQLRLRAFQRRRVQLRQVLGTTAVLANGPPKGMLVVTEGAQELFGAETGFSK